VEPLNRQAACLRAPHRQAKGAKRIKS